MSDEYDDDMDEMYEMTPEGLAMLADDEDGSAPLDARTALSLEVMRQVGGECTGRELEYYCDEIVTAYGSDAMALLALRRGVTRMQRIDN
jgi:hypothetical protein